MIKNPSFFISIIKILSEKDFLFMHGWRTGQLASAIAKEMGYDEDGIKQVYFAAFFHDIGKIEIPESILNKPGVLSDHERAIMQKHPELGYKILKDLRSESFFAEVALQHHERLNGSGYPHGLQAGDINFIAKIVSVADVVDAMISQQVYRPEKNMDDAICEIKENIGILYDPEVVEVCLTVLASDHWGAGVDGHQHLCLENI